MIVVPSQTIFNGTGNMMEPGSSEYFGMTYEQERYVSEQHTSEYDFSHELQQFGYANADPAKNHLNYMSWDNQSSNNIHNSIFLNDASYLASSNEDSENCHRSFSSNPNRFLLPSGTDTFLTSNTIEMDSGILMPQLLHGQQASYGSLSMFQSDGLPANALDHAANSMYSQKITEEVNVRFERVNSVTNVQHGQVTPVPSPPELVNSDSSGKRKASEGTSSQGVDEPVTEVLPPKPKRGRRKKNKIQTEEEKKDHRDHFLARNRNAAAKCRINKKLWQEQLKDHARSAQLKNNQLRQELSTLQEEYDQLRSFIVTHQRTCEDIDGKLGDWLDEHAANVFGLPLTKTSQVQSPMELDSDDESNKSIARINQDYTGKRTISISDQQPFTNGVSTRPQSAPQTPGSSMMEDMMSFQHRRYNSQSAPGIRPRHGHEDVTVGMVVASPASTREADSLINYFD